ncbi:MAG: PKD domain-containing protein [Halioglobus sp.]|nr:PKD domain-containing protein [Halioglobus sp.]
MQAVWSAMIVVAVVTATTISVKASQKESVMTMPAAEDTLFSEPYTDTDEWRDTPVRHRYVHGGFKNTDTRFSYYFPEKASYEGRFFQYVTPVPDSENLAQNPENADDKIGFSIDSGAYFIETNGGGSAATAGPAFYADPSIAAYRANAAAARYSRVVAAQMYGAHRPFGYLYGGSGGGYRTLGSMENTEGVWDGAVPFVLGSPMAAPNVFAVRMHAMRILKDKFPQIIDAMDAGGSGDPYAGLNEEEAAALREVTRMGFPPNSWFEYDSMGVHAFTLLYQGMVMADPSYFDDFWTVPGYLGANPPESLKKARLQFETTIRAALSDEEATAKGLESVRDLGVDRGTADSAWKVLVNDGSDRPAAFQLADAPPDVGFLGGDLVVLSGEGAGKRVAVREIIGDVVTLGVADVSTLALLNPGDKVRVDNSNFLAAQTYHRHQVPDASYKVWDQFRNKDGKPIYPQRAINLGPLFAMGAAGTVPSGKIHGKIIVVQSGLDREAFPWQADWYAQRFKEHLGDKADDYYRLWFTENALHSPSESERAPTRVISYMPVLQQALRDLAQWVEKGIPPPPTTGYTVVDGQVILADTAAKRGGIQPLVAVSANGKSRTVVKPGQEVSFSATVEVPPGAGTIVSAQWDFDGEGTFPVAADIAATPAAEQVITASYSFASPGTYFPVLRIESQRDGDSATPYTLIPNLGRVRVVVE